jgi:hypothetical protein
MSGLFFLGLLAIWLFAGWIVYMIWRLLGFDTTRKLVWKVVHMMIGVVLLSAWFAAGFWPFAGKKMYYDAQVREMCAKDGGINVYETVSLAEDRFDKYGNIGVVDKAHAKPSDEYYYEVDEIILRKADPTLVKYISKIIRRSDKKTLGMKIRYGRGGGDLPGFGHPSSYYCPPIKRGEKNLETTIFLKGVKND